MSLFKQRAEALRSQIHTQGSVVVNTPAQKEGFRALKQQYVRQICDEIRDLMMKEIEMDNLRCDTKRPQGFLVRSAVLQNPTIITIYVVGDVLCV